LVEEGAAGSSLGVDGEPVPPRNGLMFLLPEIEEPKPEDIASPLF
jgi:hypothetical protein